MLASPEALPAYVKELDEIAEPTPEPIERTNKNKRGRVGRALATLGLLMCMESGLYADAPRPNEVLLRHEEKLPADETELTIMTANVHSWDGAQGDNFDKFLDAVQANDADIVCVQEFLWESGKITEIYEQGYDIYFSKTVQWPGRDPFGNAIISKPPLDKLETVYLPRYTTMSPRNAILGEVMTSQGPLNITGTHLSTNTQESTYQSSLLLPFIEQRNHLVCGDFNQTPDVVASGPLGIVASPVFLSAGLPTFPARRATRAIDHIMSPCGDLIENATKVVDIDSDHLALLKNIDFEPCLDN